MKGLFNPLFAIEDACGLVAYGEGRHSRPWGREDRNPPAKPPTPGAPAVVEWAAGSGAQRPGAPGGDPGGAADWDDILARARAALPPKETRPRRDE